MRLAPSESNVQMLRQITQSLTQTRQQALQDASTLLTQSGACMDSLTRGDADCLKELVLAAARDARSMADVLEKLAHECAALAEELEQELHRQTLSAVPAFTGTAGGAGVYGSVPNPRGFRSFGSLEDAHAYHTQANFSRQKWDALPAAQRSAIERYTGPYYSAMNAYLRDGKDTPYIAGLVADAGLGLAGWQVAEDTMVWRGTNANRTARLLGCNEAQLRNPAFLSSMIGKTVTDPGFMSTAIHPSEAKKWAGGVMYTIFARKGANAMYVDPVSSNRGERELLFNRDARFRVHAIRTNADGQLAELFLEALPAAR